MIVEVTSDLGSKARHLLPESTAADFDHKDITQEKVDALVARYLDSIAQGKFRCSPSKSEKSPGKGKEDWPEPAEKVYSYYGVSKMFLDKYAQLLAKKLQPEGQFPNFFLYK